MGKAKFEKISPTEKRLYGPEKLILCGFPVAAQPKFNKLLQMIGLESLSKTWVTNDQHDAPVSELIHLPDESGAGSPSDMPRAIVAAGISENDLLQLMAACKKTGMVRSLWATLTPTSENWTIGQLISELEAERRFMEGVKISDSDSRGGDP